TTDSANTDSAFWRYLDSRLFRRSSYISYLADEYAPVLGTRWRRRWRPELRATHFSVDRYSHPTVQRAQAAQLDSACSEESRPRASARLNQRRNFAGTGAFPRQELQASSNPTTAEPDLAE